MIAYFEEIIQYFSTRVPLELFVIIGGFVEEIVSPIPSPIIMTTAGSIASFRGMHLVYLLLLSALASVGKTLGCVIFYYIVTKLEDVFVTKYGKYFGLKKENIEMIGNYFNNTWKDDLILTILRAIPFFPSLPVSVLCGAIKLNIGTYIRATFIGSFIRSLFFGYIGFLGFEGYKEILVKFDKFEDIILYASAVLIGGLVLVVYHYKNKIDFYAIINKYFSTKKIS